MPPKNPNIFLAVVSLTVLALYASIVFLGYAILFGIYQYLRDHGHGFWTSVTLMVLFSCLLAVPSIVLRLQNRR